MNATHTAPHRASAAQEHEVGSERAVFSPSPAAMGATFLAAFVFVVLLEFLVVISFVGQGLWSDPRLFHDHVFTLPLYIWFAVGALTVVAVLRIATQRIVLDGNVISVRGMFRVPTKAALADIAGLWLVRDVYRGNGPHDPVNSLTDAHDAAILMTRDRKRIANVSGAFYGMKAQNVVRSLADRHGLKVETIDQIRPNDLAHEVPGSMSFVDLHPNLLVVGIVLFYAAHNVLTFFIWGL